MFIDTDGLPGAEHHRHGGGQLHQQHDHYHGDRHLQQLGQLHLPYWSGRVTASRNLLPSAPHHHGHLAPATLLLKNPPPDPAAMPPRHPLPPPNHNHTLPHPSTPCAPPYPLGLLCAALKQRPQD